MIENMAKLSTYDEDSKAAVLVKSMADKHFVEIEVEGKKIMVAGLDLIIAIQNCMNTGV